MPKYPIIHYSIYPHTNTGHTRHASSLYISPKSQDGTDVVNSRLHFELRYMLSLPFFCKNQMIYHIYAALIIDYSPLICLSIQGFFVNIFSIFPFMLQELKDLWHFLNYAPLRTVHVDFWFPKRDDMFSSHLFDVRFTKILMQLTQPMNDSLWEKRKNLNLNERCGNSRICYDFRLLSFQFLPTLPIMIKSTKP